MNYQITLSISDSTNKIAHYEVIKSNDLVQLMVQLSMLVVCVQRDMHEDELLKLRMIDDDIPF